MRNEPPVWHISTTGTNVPVGVHIDLAIATCEYLGATGTSHLPRATNARAHRLTCMCMLPIWASTRTERRIKCIVHTSDKSKPYARKELSPLDRFVLAAALNCR